MSLYESLFFIYYRIALAIPPAGKNDDAIISGYSRCSMYKVNFTEILQDGTILIGDPSWPTQKCQFGWEYNFTDIPYETIATQVTLSFNVNNFFLFFKIIPIIVKT